MIGTISEVIDNDVGSRPIIVQFQNSELQEGEEGKLHTKIFKKGKNKTIVTAATKNILYTGQIDKKNEDNLYNRYLLIRNKRTGKVKLITVDSVPVSPHFPSKNKRKDELNKSDANTSVNLLNKEFGSKKIKRMTEQRERLKMNIDDVKDQLEQTVAGVELNENEPFTVQTSENESSYRPPINRSGSIVQQVYVLNDIVPEHVLDSLEEEANYVLTTDETLELSAPIMDKIEELQNSSANDVLDQCKLMLYVDYLIKYINTQAKNITKKYKACNSSEEVNRHILDNFSVPTQSGRTRPVSMRDKTLCYILVLSMIAFNYELDMEKLAKSVKVGVKKLQEMGRILAFSTHGKNKNLMTLKIPLPPPISLSPRKRKR